MHILDSLMQQNEKILSLIRQQNDKLVETIEADKLAPQLVFSRKISGYSQLFPIKSLKELDELEQLINDNNVNELVSLIFVNWDTSYNAFTISGGRGSPIASSSWHC